MATTKTQTGTSDLASLDALGFSGLAGVYRNLPPPCLYEQAVTRQEGLIADHGPLVVLTGKHTGRSADDKFIVREPSSESRIWWGKVNRPFEEKKFDDLFGRVKEFMRGRDVFVQDCYAGADPKYRVSVRVITEKAWHSLFAKNLFIDPPANDLERFEPTFTIVDVPSFEAVPDRDGTRSGAFIMLHLGRRLVVIGGTRYAGEIKKSMFTVMNYLLPQQGVMSMHCSANMGATGDVALFFGLSGTGKTTLSADPERLLIGDDEHGWSDHGVFNVEGGCYAKVIKLSADAEPQIYQTTRRFGTVIENVAMNKVTRSLDLNDDSVTENTRAAYPLSQLDHVAKDGMGGHPSHIFMLTADAFGVLPPISRLTADQAMYHFLCGYTAKVAGTEQGVKEPKTTFSTCFGAPFLPLQPEVYAKLFGQKIEQHKVRVWLLNTGWTGGPYGIGHRFSIAHTRALLRAAIRGALESVPMKKDVIFGMDVPTQCDGVPAELFSPRGTWKQATDYDRAAKDLAEQFRKNFKTFETLVSPAVRAAGPLA